MLPGILIQLGACFAADHKSLRTTKEMCKYLGRPTRLPVWPEHVIPSGNCGLIVAHSTESHLMAAGVQGSG